MAKITRTMGIGKPIQASALEHTMAMSKVFDLPTNGNLLIGRKGYNINRDLCVSKVYTDKEEIVVNLRVNMIGIGTQIIQVDDKRVKIQCKVDFKKGTIQVTANDPSIKRASVEFSISREAVQH